MTPFLSRPVNALVRFGLNSPAASRLVAFYEQAFGAQLHSREALHELRWAGIEGGAERTTLSLGTATVEILEFDHPGRAYPRELSPYDPRFQHFAIVVTDMQRAMERLRAFVGWTAISTEGPQTLPPETGAVTAFKFRDPDGHPLELLEFSKGKSPAYWQREIATGIVSGIDHSALSVRHLEISINFYQSLGLRVSARTLNQGREQERLDGVAAPRVDVVALAPHLATPHVELLHYRTGSPPPVAMLAVNDTAASRLIFSAGDSEDPHPACGRLVQDPDGHFLELDDAPAGR